MKLYLSHGRCESGCHAQGWAFLWPIQAEYSFDATKLRFGGRIDLNRAVLGIGAVLYLGPFQVALALRLIGAEVQS
jgi:hypothetical protein